jgi:hypothetical protein
MSVRICNSHSACAIACSNRRRNQWQSGSAKSKSEYFLQSSRYCWRSWHGYQPLLSFALGGQANGKPPYWNWDYKDLSPRLAFAYSPRHDSGLSHKLSGAKGKSSPPSGPPRARISHRPSIAKNLAQARHGERSLIIGATERSCSTQISTSRFVWVQC